MGCGAGKEAVVKDYKREGRDTKDGYEMSAASLRSDLEDNNISLPPEEMKKLDEIEKTLMNFKDYKLDNDGKVTLGDECVKINEVLVYEACTNVKNNNIFLTKLGNICLKSGMLPNMVKLLELLMTEWIRSGDNMDESSANNMSDLLTTFRNLSFYNSRFAIEILRYGILVPVAQCMKHYHKDFEKEGDEMVSKYLNNEVDEHFAFEVPYWQFCHMFLRILTFKELNCDRMSNVCTA